MFWVIFGLLIRFAYVYLKNIKTNIISAINQYFALENWDFGETFYFSELSSFIMQQLAPNIVTLVIVPKQENQGFGSLYEIKSETDEIFISGDSIIPT